MTLSNSIVLKKHGVTLTPLDSSHLEMLRNWRNSDFVRSFMLYQDEISQSEQQQWFVKLQDSQKFYFIISDENGEYGCCNINLEVDEAGNLCAEGGIFSADESKLNSLTPIKAICTLYQWAFTERGINYVKARIRSENKRAIRFNHGLGFQVDNVAEGITYATLTRESFEHRYNKIERVLG
ncbi:GNAT family N-acetyltransferase [Vibrio parahaemolyticus]|uniref:GNAT family N-acetyltransferase n=1 Tax=Vibrio parahaemolyticus TaxID=670 RepID=UPI00186A5355|nr:GNAT family N-acetyltransferase [Vibrio parahaemolyticus]MBE3922712.1 GNAT family N-acetyltransferase [Vibrio parahaemolyticus]